MSTESKSLVEEANAAFYRALESRAIERMDEVWAHGDDVRCVHPGWDVVTGWQRVRESWERIFETGQRVKVSPSEVSVSTHGDFAWVTCTESITVFQETDFDFAQAVATNLFVRREGRWLMVHHHSSAVPILLSEGFSDEIQ
jgi:uncharacterized protein (TIGR02246 family)